MFTSVLLVTKFDVTSALWLKCVPPRVLLPEWPEMNYVIRLLIISGVPSLTGTNTFSVKVSVGMLTEASISVSVVL